MWKSSTIDVNEFAFSIVLILKMSSLQNTHEIILYTVILGVIVSKNVCSNQPFGTNLPFRFQPVSKDIQTTHLTGSFPFFTKC